MTIKPWHQEINEVLRGGPVDIPLFPEPTPLIENKNLQLRDYQQECLDKIDQAWQNGITRQLIALPTGTGKTVLFAQLPLVFPNRRMLVIAHREELLEQAAEKIGWANPGIAIDIEKAERKASSHADVVVGSIQSLSGKHGKTRLERLDPETFGVVVVDEAHHALAMTYLQLLARFGKAPDLSDLDSSISGNRLNRILHERCTSFVPDSHSLLVGFTATPHRTDGIGLHYAFDDIAFSRTIKEMMTAPAPGPWLCDINGYSFESGLSLKGVKTRMGDYAAGDLAQKVNVEERNIAAVKAYIALASGRQAICFCVDVAHSLAMLEQFTDYGVSAACILGADESEQRRRAVAGFKAGEIEVLVNCMVLTEGFDHAATSCIIMARPTKSQLLYTQMLGRGTRLAEGKKNLLVIDLADTDSVGVANLNTLFGLPPKLEVKEKGVVKAEEEFEEVIEEQQVDPGMLDGAHTIEEVRQLARQYNPLGIPQMPEWIRHSLSWSKTSFGYVLPVNKFVSVGVVIDLLEHAQVQIKRRDPSTRNPMPVEVMAQTFPTASAAIESVEQMVRSEYPDDIPLLDKSAPWRQRAMSEPATGAQLDYLRHLRVVHDPDISKAEASILISNAKAKREFKAGDE